MWEGPFKFIWAGVGPAFQRQILLLSACSLEKFPLPLGKGRGAPSTPRVAAIHLPPPHAVARRALQGKAGSGQPMGPGGRWGVTVASKIPQVVGGGVGCWGMHHHGDMVRWPCVSSGRLPQHPGALKGIWGSVKSRHSRWSDWPESALCVTPPRQLCLAGWSTPRRTRMGLGGCQHSFAVRDAGALPY